jgi:hypothetical protein
MKRKKAICNANNFLLSLFCFWWQIFLSIHPCLQVEYLNAYPSLPRKCLQSKQTHSRHRYGHRGTFGALMSISGSGWFITNTIPWFYTRIASFSSLPVIFSLCLMLSCSFCRLALTINLLSLAYFLCPFPLRFLSCFSFSFVLSCTETPLFFIFYFLSSIFHIFVFCWSLFIHYCVFSLIFTYCFQVKKNSPLSITYTLFLLYSFIILFPRSCLSDSLFLRCPTRYFGKIFRISDFADMMSITLVFL